MQLMLAIIFTPAPGKFQPEKGVLIRLSGFRKYSSKVIVCPPHEPRFKRDTAGVVCFTHSQLVVTTTLILTFYPGQKGQRLQASFYAVVRRANPVACALGFMGSMRERFRGILSPVERVFSVPVFRYS